jgi:cellulose biosynthesis protein BcsQ
MLEKLDVTIGLGKGGVIKSTTAMMLAFAIHRRTGKPVAVIDADPKSQSATDWQNFAGQDWPAGIRVYSWHDENLRRNVAALKPDFPYIIRDTGGDRPRILRDCLMDTDLLLATVPPMGADYRHLPSTVDLAARVASEHNPNLGILAVLVKANLSDPNTQQVMAELDAAGMEYAQTIIPDNRYSYGAMWGTVPDRLLRYRALADEILEVAA